MSSVVKIRPTIHHMRPENRLSTITASSASTSQRQSINNDDIEICSQTTSLMTNREVMRRSRRRRKKSPKDKQDDNTPQLKYQPSHLYSRVQQEEQQLNIFLPIILILSGGGMLTLGVNCTLRYLEDETEIISAHGEEADARKFPNYLFGPPTLALGTTLFVMGCCVLDMIIGDSIRRAIRRVMLNCGCPRICMPRTKYSKR